MPRTPDKYDGRREETEVLFEEQAADPSDTGAMLYRGAPTNAFRAKDGTGVFDLRDPLSKLTPAQGDIVYFNGTSWVRLAAGTAGQILQTNGAGANPSWVTPIPRSHQIAADAHLFNEVSTTFATQLACDVVLDSVHAWKTLHVLIGLYGTALGGANAEARIQFTDVPFGGSTTINGTAITTTATAETLLKQDFDLSSVTTNKIWRMNVQLRVSSAGGTASIRYKDLTLVA